LNPFDSLSLAQGQCEALATCPWKQSAITAFFTTTHQASPEGVNEFTKVTKYILIDVKAVIYAWE
jgi:hypothetical protein